ncbi:MAG: DUF4132 domain-containing protein [Chloroflexi bacterium]|nr:DUF4132 domain-containing protein [Chloroflexota bacterium]
MDLIERLTAALNAGRPVPRHVARHVARAQPYLAMPANERPTRALGVVGGDDASSSTPQASWSSAWLDAPESDRISIGVAILDLMTQRGAVRHVHDAAAMLPALGRVAPPHHEEDRHAVLDLARRIAGTGWYGTSPVSYAIAMLERTRAAGVSLDGDARRIDALVTAITTHHGLSTAELGRSRTRLLSLAHPDHLDLDLIVTHDTWGTAVRTWLADHPEAATAGPLITHLGRASSVTPTRRWTQELHPFLEQPVTEPLVRHMVDASFESRITSGMGADWIGTAGTHPANGAIVRGAYWAAAAGWAVAPNTWSWVPETLARAGAHWALSPRNDNYPRDERLANTTVWLLADIATPETLVALGRIKARVRSRNVSKQLSRALERAATNAGITPGELLELSVPTCGLDPSGHRELPVGDGAAVLTLDPDGEASLTWLDAAAKVTRTVPKALGASDPSAVTSAKAELKELRLALSVERSRLEDLLVEDRSWTAEAWREHYLQHPLTAALARRLIWQVEGSTDGADGTSGADGGAWTCVPHADGWLWSDGAQRELPDHAQVTLWHPARASVAEVQAWRERLLATRIRQPFKQAWREVYLLTPAEETTATYSNRFASHILDYPVARALMGARRWASNYLGPFDGGFEGIARRDFPAHDLRAAFYHDAVEEGVDVVQHCATDQVRFWRLSDRAETPVALTEIPPLVLSEAMRDVDLFVGVSSIAADENWADGGPDRRDRFGLYWETTAFGELDGSAETRRQALELLIPQLAIADRLTLDGRFLRVRGELATYRIHLGSGNILMEPGDVYLCIVPARSAAARADRVFLPFDDDHRLSLILSKAVLLADDRRITDPTIVAQIEAHGRSR